MTSFNPGVLSAPINALMAEIPMIPSHVEAGRIIHVEREDQRAELDPLIEMDLRTIAEPRASTTPKRFAKIAAAFSKDGNPDGSEFFEEVSRVNGLMDGELDSVKSGRTESITVSELLRRRADYGHRADGMLYGVASSLSELGEICLEECADKLEAADAYFQSAVLFAALKDYGNADERARLLFLNAGEKFGHPVAKAIAYETIRHEQAIFRWLDAADLLSADDPLGAQIAIFRGLYLSSRISYKPKIVDFLVRYAVSDYKRPSGEDEAENYMRIVKHIFDGGIFISPRLRAMRSKLSKAAVAWDKVGDEKRSAMANELSGMIPTG